MQATPEIRVITVLVAVGALEVWPETRAAPETPESEAQPETRVQVERGVTLGLAAQVVALVPLGLTLL